MVALRRSPLTWFVAAVAAMTLLGAGYLYLTRPTSSQRPAGTAALPGGIRIPVHAPVEGPRFAGANVLVISIDTLRRDHLAPYGATFDTPAASRLAREGVVFERAVSHVPLTLPAHTSIFTGLYPPRHSVRDNGGVVPAEDVTTLADRFRSHGYRTAAFVSSYVLHSRWGLAQGHDTYDDHFDYVGLERRSLTDVERPAGPAVDAALAWLRRLQRGAPSFYMWIHLFDPHEPYDPPDAYRRRAPTPYAGEVVYADSQVARLLEALDDLALRQNTLIVYLSDHGESLGEHGESTHGIFLYGATLDVPLIIAPPTGATIGSPAVSFAGRRISGLARLVDVTPTVLDLVGLPVPSGLDGASLLPLLAAGDAAPADSASSGTPDALDGPVSYAETYYPRFHYNWSELFAVETERWRFVRAPRPELYDLRQEPRDRHDVTADHPGVAATLAGHLEAMTRQQTGDEPAPATLDPDALARLRTLGYVSGGEISAVRRTGPRPDPKRALPLLNELLQAQTDRDAGRFDDAARRLEALAQRDSENPAVHLALSSVYDRRGDRNGAIRAATRAVALDSESVVAVLNLAFAFRAAGRTDAAAAGFERALALDPENLKALLSLAEIHHTRGEHEKAFDLYQRAVAVAPRLVRARLGMGSLALELNRLDVADDALQQAVALGGDEPHLHFNLGVLAEQRGQIARAAREYRTEVAAYPGSIAAWVNLGLLERQAGRVGAALTAFERAASADSTRAEGPYLLAETLASLGRRQDAERWVEEALRRRPHDPRAERLVQEIRRPSAGGR